MVAYDFGDCYDDDCPDMSSAMMRHPRYASFHYQPYAIMQTGNHSRGLVHASDN